MRRTLAGESVGCPDFVIDDGETLTGMRISNPLFFRNVPPNVTESYGTYRGFLVVEQSAWGDDGIARPVVKLYAFVRRADGNRWQLRHAGDFDAHAEALARADEILAAGSLARGDERKNAAGATCNGQ